MAKTKFPAPSIPVLTERFRRLQTAMEASDEKIASRALCFRGGALWALETVGYSRDMVEALQTKPETQDDFSFLLDEESTPPDAMDPTEGDSLPADDPIAMVAEVFAGTPSNEEFEMAQEETPELTDTETDARARSARARRRNG